MGPPLARRFHVDLVLPLLAALVLRLAWFVLVMRNSAIESAAVDYPAIAERLVSGDRGGAAAGLVQGGSFFPALMAIGEVLTRGAISLPSVGRLISAGFGALLVIPVFGLAESVYGRRPAVIAAWAVAFHPLLITVSTTVLSVQRGLLPPTS